MDVEGQVGGGVKLDMYAAVVMPDHVHLLFTDRMDHPVSTFGMREIIAGIKGASAHRINRALARTGQVWQDESFDHMLRCDESLREKAEYICQNPVRWGLCGSPEEYPWLWRGWVD